MDILGSLESQASQHVLALVKLDVKDFQKLPLAVLIGTQFNNITKIESRNIYAKGICHWVELCLIKLTRDAL